MLFRSSAAVPTIVSLSRHLPPRVELWLGGPAAPDAAERAGRRALVLTTYRDFERELGRLGGRLPPSS